VYDFGSGDQRGIGDNAAAIARWNQQKNTWTRVSRVQGYL
jgi:hypothetical protein